MIDIATAQREEACAPANDSLCASPKRVTVYDIAARIGVSHTTVALALRDNPGVATKTREQVQRVAAQMGYRPDPALSALAAYRRGLSPAKFQGTIAWMRDSHQADYRAKLEFHRGLWRGSVQAAERLGYRVEEFCWEPGCTAKRVEQILISRGIQGLLISPHRLVPDWGNFDWNKFSIVRFGISVPIPDSNLVTQDAFRAMMMAVTRIRDYGYQRIGLVVGKFDETIGGNFCGGFLAAQQYLKLAPAIPVLIASGDRPLPGSGTDEDKKSLARWLKRHKPDAILTTEGQLPAQLRDLGYRIPEDIAIAGTCVPDVPVDSGIDQNGESIGRIALETLVKQINMGERGEPLDPTRILVESRWRDGNSLPHRN